MTHFFTTHTDDRLIDKDSLWGGLNIQKRGLGVNGVLALPFSPCPCHPRSKIVIGGLNPQEAKASFYGSAGNFPT
jgi:hypothetical protein